MRSQNQTKPAMLRQYVSLFCEQITQIIIRRSYIRGFATLRLGRATLVLMIIWGGWFLFADDQAKQTTGVAAAPAEIVVTQNVIGPYPKTGVTLMTFPLYNGCPDVIDKSNPQHQACLDQWLNVTAELLTELDVDLFRLPFGASAGNEIIGPDLLEPLATRPLFSGRHFAGQSMMIGWPEAEMLAQATDAEVMWVLNVLDLVGVGTLAQAETVVQTLKGKVHYYELGSEVFRPSLLGLYQERLTRFGGLIQAEDPDALYAAVLRDDFVWPELLPPLDAHWWKNGIVNTPGPHRLQRHLYFPGGDGRIKFHQSETPFFFSMPLTQSGVHTLTLTFSHTTALDATNVTVTAGASSLVGTVAALDTGLNGVTTTLQFAGDLPTGEHEGIITSKLDGLLIMEALSHLTGPDGTGQQHSLLEGRSGWQLYLAGAHGLGQDLIPQDIGPRKVWVSEISDVGDTPHSEADGRWGHRWLDALAYGSGFMLAASDPRVEIILGHTLYEIPFHGLVGGVGRAPWEPWQSIEANIDPKRRPKFWVHQQMARHLKNGQQLDVQMPLYYYQLDGTLQMGYSGRTAQQIPLLECWASDLDSKQSLLCLNRAYEQSFSYPVRFTGSDALTARMTLLTGHPGDHNEGEQPMVEPQFQTVELSNVTFPPRSLVRLEIEKTLDLYLPLIIKSDTLY